jgi:hypothetical protein
MAARDGYPLSIQHHGAVVLTMCIYKARPVIKEVDVVKEKAVPQNNHQSTHRDFSQRAKKNILWVFLVLFFICSNIVYANILRENTVSYLDHQSDTYFWSGLDLWLTNYPIARYNGKDWGWTHTFIPPDPNAGQIISATIAIEAYDVDECELHIVNVGGIPIGTLTGNDEIMSTTVLDLPPMTFDDLSDGLTEVWINIGTQASIGWVTIKSSTLTVEYGTPTIPEPSTLSLWTLGFLMYRRRITGSH